MVKLTGQLTSYIQQIYSLLGNLKSPQNMNKINTPRTICKVDKMHIRNKYTCKQPPPLPLPLPPKKKNLKPIN